ncbi:MAG TPA: TonB-dependent receptor, partial [Rhodanobacter sp.]|nr:TonB-dependent receptor [Rhodanobacter sp.]
MSSSRNLRKTILCMALGLGLGSLAPAAFAGSNDGSVVGHTTASASVTVTNADTGFTRTVTADEKGNYRFPFLPVGTYTLQASSGSSPVGQPVQVTVSLGNATTVNVGASASATNLDAINVSGTILPGVDVTSTESATNVTREQLTRLPVDQNITSVAVLAPGVNKGVAGFGGISFGGSSVAENSFYVNGLNVTDFYNRNGFSSAPFAFYQEFQVKTGGYSVEFGRTTGGVINAVTRSGTNEFHFGTEITLEPGNWHSRADDHYRTDGTRYLTASRDRDSLVKLNGYASGPIIQDKLFFFAMYEARGASPRNTNDAGTTFTSNNADTGFWGVNLDWHINDSNLLNLMAFSDKDQNIGKVYDYTYDGNVIGDKTNEIYTDTGGKNWALTWTSYLTSDLSMKLMYGRNDRNSFNRGLSDLDCNRVVSDGKIALPNVGLGCTTNSLVQERNDVRKQARADFEWTLGDHLVRFGFDHEQDTSDYNRYYPGPG